MDFHLPFDLIIFFFRFFLLFFVAVIVAVAAKGIDHNDDNYDDTDNKTEEWLDTLENNSSTIDNSYLVDGANTVDINIYFIGVDSQVVGHRWHLHLS